MEDFSDLFDVETSGEFENLWDEIETQQFPTPPLLPFTRSSSSSSSLKTGAEASENQPTLLKSLLNEPPKHTPFKVVTENTTGPVIEGEKTSIKSQRPFKRYSTCSTTTTNSTSVETPKYSPPLDENWPPAETGSESFSNAEDSILTTLRRNKKKKMSALEKRFSDPLMSASQEFNVLKHLQKRIATDMVQSQIIINYLSAKHGGDEPAKKRVKFSTL